MKDARGVDRGACKKCNCSEYAPPDAEEMAGMSCVSCGHAPGSHLNQDRAPASVAAHCSTQTLSSTCRVPGCNELVDFDLNTGLELGCYCFQHISSSFAPMECQDIEDENMVYQGGICDGTLNQN